MNRGLFGVVDEVASSAETEGGAKLLIFDKGRTTLNSIENRYKSLQTLMKAKDNALIDDQREREASRVDQAFDRYKIYAGNCRQAVVAWAIKQHLSTHFKGLGESNDSSYCSTWTYYDEVKKLFNNKDLFIDNENPQRNLNPLPIPYKEYYKLTFANAEAVSHTLILSTISSICSKNRLTLISTRTQKLTTQLHTSSRPQ